MMDEPEPIPYVITLNKLLERIGDIALGMRADGLSPTHVHLSECLYELVSKNSAWQPSPVREDPFVLSPHLMGLKAERVLITGRLFMVEDRLRQRIRYLDLGEEIEKQAKEAGK